MFDEPDEEPTERSASPAQRARDKFDEFRMHAERAAVFEGPRKFDAALVPGLDPQLARDVQRGIGKLEKAWVGDGPFLGETATADAADLLDLPATGGLTTNDYHIHRRPGETMVVRWLAGDQVQTFYERLQAHFDAALNAFRDDEQQAQEWKQDPDTLAYLTALAAIDEKLADRAHRAEIRQHELFSLATQTVDEINIALLSDHLMGVAAADLVGPKSAPPDDPSEQDLTWFFKLFLLRGVRAGVEQMCCFTYLQKADDPLED